MPAPGQDHLATITPIEAGESHQMMNPLNLILNSVCFVAFQTAWIWIGLISLTLYNSEDAVSATIGTFGVVLAMAWLVAQFLMVFVYPEWPINGYLCSKLRRCVAGRFDRPNWVSDPGLRVVELVPRERWNKMALETATDLLLIRIDSNGIKMEGDCHRYELPCASILGAELHSLRPSGWFTDTHMVIITARTEEGAVELPISYRDHQLGCLRNSRRCRDAFDLTEQINGIATGAVYQSILADDPGNTPAPKMDRTNPYASPTPIEN